MIQNRPNKTAQNLEGRFFKSEKRRMIDKKRKSRYNQMFKNYIKREKSMKSNKWKLANEMAFRSMFQKRNYTQMNIMKKWDTKNQIRKKEMQDTLRTKLSYENEAKQMYPKVRKLQRTMKFKQPYYRI